MRDQSVGSHCRTRGIRDSPRWGGTFSRRRVAKPTRKRKDPRVQPGGESSWWRPIRSEQSLTNLDKMNLLLITSNRYQSVIDSLHQGEHAPLMGREQPVMIRRPLVSVVDDDESLRESLPDLVREFGYSAQAFSSAEAFLHPIPSTRQNVLSSMSPCRQACPGLISNGNCPAADERFRSSSSPLAPIRLFAPDYSNRVRSSACSNHSATRLCSRRLIGTSPEVSVPQFVECGKFGRDCGRATSTTGDTQASGCTNHDSLSMPL